MFPTWCKANSRTAFTFGRAAGWLSNYDLVNLHSIPMHEPLVRKYPGTQLTACPSVAFEHDTNTALGTPPQAAEIKWYMQYIHLTFLKGK
jgi:hypothetical protein